MQDLCRLEACLPTQRPVCWPPCPSPVNLSRLAQHLRNHPDQTFASYILHGFSEGFHLGFAHDKTLLQSRKGNLLASISNPNIISAHIASELAKGRLVGPVEEVLLPGIQVSPIGLVPKGHMTGRWRVIVHLSAPRNFSVNDGISEELCSLSYASLDDAVDLIRRLGPGTQLVKMDLKEAYRIVPVHPDDQHLLGISWNGQVYIDRALPFGLRSAPKIFTAIADALAWSLHAGGIRFVLHYLDDFLFIGAPNSLEATHAAQLATITFADLGVPVAVHKTEGPSSCVTFLGIQVDTDKGQLRLPWEKLQRVRDKVRPWLRRESHTRKDLESLLGHLSHAAMVIRPGRVFLRSLFALLQVVRLPHHYVRLNMTARADLQWWNHFLQLWNGVSIFPVSLPKCNVFTDASGSFGCGAFDPCLGEFQVQWPATWAEVDISVKEVVPLVFATALWGPAWTGCLVQFHVDNMAVVAVIQKRSAKNDLLTHFLRCICFYGAYFHFEFSASHVPGEHNTAADALSRDNLTLFASLFPQVPLLSVPLPLLNLILHQPPKWGCPKWIEQFKASLHRDFRHQPCLPM